MEYQEVLYSSISQKVFSNIVADTSTMVLRQQCLLSLLAFLNVGIKQSVDRKLILNCICTKLASGLSILN